MNRREFFRNSALAGVSVIWLPSSAIKDLLIGDRKRLEHGRALVFDSGWSLSINREIPVRNIRGIPFPTAGVQSANLKIECKIDSPAFRVFEKALADQSILPVDLLDAESGYSFSCKFYVTGIEANPAYIGYSEETVTVELTSQGKLLMEFIA